MERELALLADAALSAAPHVRPLIRLLRIAPEEALFKRRGFPETGARHRLESAGLAFIAGHNLALSERSVRGIMASVVAAPAGLRGFFAEGAAMGAAVRALLHPWRNGLPPLITALTPLHAHLAHVGVGWAMARVPFARHWLARALDPMLAPLALDGRGFHDGYFHPTAVAHGWRGLSGRGDRIAVYDQGIGRAFWFSSGADPGRIAAAIAAMPENRRADLWAGIGLAAVYAGGSGDGDLERLRRAAGGHGRSLAQGAAFAVGAHHRAGAVPEEAAGGAMILTGLEVDALVAIVDRSFEATKALAGAPLVRYQNWRRRVMNAIEDGTKG